MKAGVPALAVLLIALLSAACGGGGSTTTTVRTIVPASTPIAVTGAPELDQLASFAVALDSIQLAALAGYSRVPCVTGDQTPGAVIAPVCRDYESPNAPVEVMPLTKACQAGYVRPEQLPDAFNSSLGKTPKLMAVYKPKPDPASFGAGFGTTSVIVLQTGAHDDGQPSGVALHINGGRVLWIENDCGNLFQLITPERVDSYLLSPGAAAPSAATSVPAAPTAVDTPAP